MEEQLKLDDLPDVVTTSQYARVMQVSVKTLVYQMRNGDKHIASPINPNARCGYRFDKQQIIKKIRGR